MLFATAKKHFPHLAILARASDRPDAYDLLEAGVEHVYRETLDSSLETGVQALRLLGFRSFQALRRDFGDTVSGGTASGGTASGDENEAFE